MLLPTEKKKLGVIVGRFQVPELTLAHTILIDHASLGADELLILLGTVIAQPTQRNPLSYEIRKGMIHKEYPNAIIDVLYDHPSDEEWSYQVDTKILKAVNLELFDVTLFCGRDSFRSHYSGQFNVFEIPPVDMVSGTNTRDECKVYSDSINNRAFRKGVIHSVYNRFPGVYLCVDVAVLHPDRAEVLLARKPGREYWQFIGGFVDPTDYDLEAAAAREVKEESGLSTLGFTMLGQSKINDHRYRNTEAAIFSIFYSCFQATHHNETAIAGDDIEEVKWFSLDNLPLLPLMGGMHNYFKNLLLEYYAT